MGSWEPPQTGPNVAATQTPEGTARSAAPSPAGVGGLWQTPQALMAFQRSLSVLLMLPVWQGIEAMSSR